MLRCVFVHAVLVGKPESNVPAGDRRGLLVVAEAQRQRGQEPVLRDYARSLARRRGLLVRGHRDRRPRRCAIVLRGEPTPRRVRHHRPILGEHRLEGARAVHAAGPPGGAEAQSLIGGLVVLPPRYAPLQPNGNGIQSINPAKTSANDDGNSVRYTPDDTGLRLALMRSHQGAVSLVSEKYDADTGVCREIPNN